MVYLQYSIFLYPEAEKFIFLWGEEIIRRFFLNQTKFFLGGTQLDAKFSKISNDF